jgi:hypothetical protein
MGAVSHRRIVGHRSVNKRNHMEEVVLVVVKNQEVYTLLAILLELLNNLNVYCFFHALSCF